MNKNLKETDTRVNLMRAFEGESMGRNRYTIYSSVARKEGYIEIAEKFLEIAENEREHAKIFFKYLDGDDVDMVNSNYRIFPSCLGNTKENLLCASSGEKEEGELIYPEFSKIALKEGFDDIAKTFELIGKIELHHMGVFNKYARLLEDKTLYKKSEKTKWICRKCGHISDSTTPPEKCPVCRHDIGYFEELGE